MTTESHDGMLEWPVNGFLDRLAARMPTPGGGAVAGATGALAAALGRMVASYSVRKSMTDEQRAPVAKALAELSRADAMLRSFIVEDAVAYGRYAEMGDKSADQKQAALTAAMQVPLSIAATAGTVLAVFEDLAPLASKWMRSDLAAAAILAEAAVRCAGCSVRVNAGMLTDRNAAVQAEARQSDVARRSVERLEAIGKVLGQTV